MTPQRSPLGELLAIAAPTVATMTSYTLMQFVDKLVVSRIGPDTVFVGAQGDGGIAAFLPMSICQGVLTIINTYVSQNLGAGRAERAPSYAWNGLWIALIWAVVLLPYGYFLHDIFLAMGKDPEHARLAAEYGSILVYGSFLSLATRGLAQFFYGMHRPVVVLVAGVASNVINLVLTIGLVHGKWGMPALGVPGSAIGTVIATAVELAIPMALFLSPKYDALYRTRSAWRWSWERVREIVKLGWPGGAMFGNEMICWTLFMVVLVGRFGDLHSTAGWITHQWMSLSFMPAVGLSVAVTAVVGKYMGAGRPDLAQQRAWLATGVAAAYMTMCGVVFVVLREPLARVFIQEDTAPDDVAKLVKLAGGFLIAVAAFQLFDAIAMMVSGALRGAGDTVWPGIATLILSWVCIVGGGYALVTWAPQLESLGPWIAAASYIAALCLALSWRFASGRWKSIRLVTHEAFAAGAVEPGVASAATTDGI